MYELMTYCDSRQSPPSVRAKPPPRPILKELERHAFNSQFPQFSNLIHLSLTVLICKMGHLTC